jgi:hypothetical protein
LRDVNAGDLIGIEWCDASIGKSLGSGTGVDVHVLSIGIYVGTLGETSKYIVIAQNNFRYADGLYDIDYTSMPLAWSTRVSVLIKGYFVQPQLQQLLNSFIAGGRRNFGRKGNRRGLQRLRNHHSGNLNRVVLHERID